MKTLKKNPQKMFTRFNFLRRKFIVYILIILVLYVGSYSALSFVGSYRSGISGNRRYTMGLAYPDIAVWCPKIGYAHLFRTINGGLTIRSDWMGLFYCPLILLDQKYIHETIDLHEVTQQELEEIQKKFGKDL